MSERVTLRPRGQRGKPAGDRSWGGTDTGGVSAGTPEPKGASALDDERRAPARGEIRLDGPRNDHSPSRVVPAVIGDDSPRTSPDAALTSEET